MDPLYHCPACCAPMRSGFSTGWQCLEGHSFTTPNPMRDQPTILLALDIHGQLKSFIPRIERPGRTMAQRSPPSPDPLDAVAMEVEQAF